jgi:hypothetical protein
MRGMAYHPFFRLDRYTLRPPKSREELVLLNDTAKDIYNEASWPIDVASDWLSKFAHGAMMLFQDEKLIGSFGMWPLTEGNLDALATNSIEESALRPVTLSQVLNQGGHQHWYIAGIFLLPDHRDHAARRSFSQLICMALNNLADSGLIRFPAQVCAVGYSREGQRLLEHLGLQVDSAATTDWGRFYRHTMASRSDFFWPTIRQTGIDQLIEPLA